MSDFIESILQGVDILIDRRLEDVAYDSTIICTIMDDSDKKNGKYSVTDGSIVYVAYSDQSTYKNGDQVRVSVPMGDFSQKKFIVGKYVTDNNTAPITYMTPVDSVLNISGNFANGIQGSILANGETQEKELWSQVFDEKFIALQEKNLYDTLILSCNFKTDLADYTLIEGNYGLRLDFVTKPSLTSTVQINNHVLIDSSEMFGNPYLFAIKSPQAKVIKLSAFGLIESASLTLYQKKNFKDANGELISTFEDSLPDNIFVSDIAVGMGCDLTLLKDNKLQLYTSDNLIYKYNSHSDITNLKNMKILWINKDDENRYVGFSDGVYDPDYDELEYLEISKENTRLTKYKNVENIPFDKQSLMLAANIDEAASAITNATNVVSRDLVRTIREFQSVLSNLKLSEDIGKLINSSKKNEEYYLPGYASSIMDLLKLSREQYAKILKYGHDKEEARINNKSFTGSWDNDWDKKDYASEILENFEKIQEQINNLLNTEADGICAGITKDGLYAGYLSTYDTFKLRIDRLMATMWGYLHKADESYEYLNKKFPSEYFTSDHDVLQTYKTKEEFTPYQEPDLSSYDNKYCIYWYRYEQNSKTPESEQLLPEGWRRLTIHDAYKQIKNLTKEDFEKGTFYILKDGKYIKATEWKSTEKNDNGEDVEIVYYKCISEADKDKINIGLPSIYYYPEGLEKPWKYRLQQEPVENVQYYKFDDQNKKYSPITDFDSPCYTKVCVNSENKEVHDLKTVGDNGTLTQYMQYDLKEEKYMVVLFYNHIMYKSNELVFTNEDTIPDKTTADQGDILIFEHLENSTDSYQKYAISNYLMDSRDSNYHRQIRCHYDGLLAKDNAFVNGQIYWYVPRSSTMIDIDEEFLKKQGFVLDEARSNIKYIPLKHAKKDDKGNIITSDLNQDDILLVKENSDLEGLDVNCVCYKREQFYTKPSDDENIYVLSTSIYNENTTYYLKEEVELCYYKTIKAYKSNEEAQYDWDKWTYKDDSGATVDNRDFWYKIKPRYEGSSKNNYIKCEFKKTQENDSVFGQQFFTFGISGTCGTRYTLAITNGSGFSATTDEQDLPIKIQIKDVDNNTLTFKDTIQDTLSVKWECVPSEINQINRSILFTTKSDTERWYDIGSKSYGIIKGIAKISLGGNIPTDEEITGSEAEKVQARRDVDLTTFYTIPWSMNDYYYIEGPTQIIYNNYGTLDSNTYNNLSYKLYTSRDIEGTNYKAGDRILDVTWSTKLYLDTGNANGVCEELTADKAEYAFYQDYMPKIIGGNTLVPAPLYLDGLKCHLIVEGKNGKDEVLWKQPIIILQNRYSSPMLNSWDGSFQINEENGTIMSSMIGAGRKNANNTFSGVLMGDVGLNIEATLNPGNHSGLGLYGFHDGAQSFGFNIDGTAFLGKANKGRIVFNGNSGQIASASYVSTSGNSGMCIDLDDGYIHMIDATGNLNNGYTAGGTKEIKISVIDPYFQITVPDGNNNSKTKSLIYVSNDAYYLQTADFKNDKSGVKIDLKNGKISAYSFILDAWIKNNEGKGQGIFLDSNPQPTATSSASYLRVGSQITGYEMRFYKDTDQSYQFSLISGSTDKLILDSRASGGYYFYAGKSDGTQYLQYKSDGVIGIKSKIFNLVAGTGDDHQIKINSAAKTYPLLIGSKFKVAWDGSITASAGTIANWEITKNYLASEYDGHRIYIASAKAIEKKEASNWMRAYEKSSNTTYFEVSSTGRLYARDANIGGSISASTISGGTISGASISGGSINITNSKTGGYLRMSTTTNPSCSGLNVGANGIDMNGHGISNCADIGTTGAVIKFKSSGIIMNDQNLYIHPEFTYVGAGAPGSGVPSLLSYIDNRVYAILPDTEVTEVFHVDGKNLKLTIKNGLITSCTEA